MKTLSRDEMKKVMGGSNLPVTCYCKAGGPISCGSMSDPNCFDTIYSICGGLNGVTCYVGAS